MCRISKTSPNLKDRGRWFFAGRYLAVSCVALTLSFWVTFSLTAQNEAPPEAADFQVIIHKDNPDENLKRAEVDRIFIGRIKGWPSSDLSVEAINQTPKSEIREQFTRAIHKKKVSAIESYWQRMIFSGRGVPPKELNSDQAVISFVGKTRGGIGYISSATSIDTETDQVKVLSIEY